MSQRYIDGFYTRDHWIVQTVTVVTCHELFSNPPSWSSETVDRRIHGQLTPSHFPTPHHLHCTAIVFTRTYYTHESCTCLSHKCACAILQRAQHAHLIPDSGSRGTGTSIPDPSAVLVESGAARRGRPGPKGRGRL